MTFNRLRPFNELPPLPPAAELESRAVLKKCIDARAALAELKGVGDTIPNQALLIRSIGLQEARLSSEIENIVTTTDDLYQALAESIDKADSASKEVLRYQDALYAGYKALTHQPLTTNLFCQIATTIKQSEMTIRAIPGTKIVDGQTKEIIYTPPEGASLIRDKLENLEEFIHGQNALDPLVKLAVMHYQFEAIHPFTDGNGRTGRIVNILFLLQADLLTLPVLYLSKFLIERKNDYYSGLREVTENAQWQPWIEFMLEGIAQTARDTQRKVLAIRELMQTTQETIREKLPKIYSKDLLETLFYYPYCKIKFLEEKGIARRQTAANYLRLLTDIGVLHSMKLGRESYFLNHKLLSILKT
jgi:Fic family protein